MNATEPGAGGSGGAQLELNPADAEAIAACHETAASRITGQAGSVPTVDGGYATADLNAILAKVLGTADDLALVNETAAAQVREVATTFTGTDASVAAAFGYMAGTSWPYNSPSVPGGPGVLADPGDPWSTP